MTFRLPLIGAPTDVAANRIDEMHEAPITIGGTTRPLGEWLTGVVSEPWTPAALFANGELGAFLDASDLSTLAQDSAGTVAVTTPDSPIGRIADKSGNDNHFTASGAARPTLRTRTGKWFIEGDGVDDTMAAATAIIPGSGPFTIIMASQTAPSAGAGAILTQYAAGQTGRLQYTVNQRASDLAVINGAFLPLINGIADGGASTGTRILEQTSRNGVPFVHTTLCKPGTDASAVYLNGVQTDSFTAAPTVYTGAPTRIIGDAVVGYGGIKRLYGMIIINRALTAAERQKAEAWFYAKALVETTTVAPPVVTAPYVFVKDIVRGVALYDKTPNFRVAPASTTKVVTALILVRRKGANLAETATVQPADIVPGSVMGLQAGDVVSFNELLYGIMLPSGNDASYTVARTLGAEMLKAEGSSGDPVARFAKEMNAVASELGMLDTNFVTPDGNDAANHYSSARDIARAAEAAFADRLIRKVADTKNYTATVVGGPNPRTIALTNSNEIIDDAGVIAGKTGSSPNAAGCLVVMYQEPTSGNRIVLCVLGSSTLAARFTDTQALLAALSSNFSWTTGTPVKL